MTLETIYYIGQTIAVIAILGSLVAIYIQIRQQNQLSRFNAIREVIEQYNALNGLVISEASLRAAINKTSPLSEDENFQLLTYAGSRCNIWSSIQTAYENGLIEERVFLAFETDVRREVAMSKNVAEAMISYMNEFPATKSIRIFRGIKEYKKRKKGEARKNTKP